MGGSTVAGRKEETPMTISPGDALAEVTGFADWETAKFHANVAGERDGAAYFRGTGERDSRIWSVAMAKDFVASGLPRFLHAEYNQAWIHGLGSELSTVTAR